MMFLNNKYTLYNKNKKILDFHCERDESSAPFFIADKIYDEEKQPFNFSSLDQWIQNRRAPRNRAHINEILRKCGCNDYEGFIRFTYGASLNDTFWIKPEEKNISWDNVSLYRNPFDKNIAKIAFDGGLMGNKLSTATPELITDGTVAKCWRRFGKDICLLKRGARLSKEEEIYGLGPYSEKYTYQLSKQICSDSLPYDVIKYHGKIASICKCFCDEDTSYAPIAYILGEKARFKQCLEYFDSIGCSEQFKEMMVLDCITFNEDRHLKNFGVLYNADSKDIIKMAPVFDNNLALFPNHNTNEMENIDPFLSNRSSSFDIDFSELAHTCMTPSIKKKLLNLQGFTFSKEGKYNLDDERLKALGKIVNWQIDVILDRKIYMISNIKQEKIRVDDISLVFDEKNIQQEARDILLNDNFKILDFDIKTDSDELLHITDCLYETIFYHNQIFLNIYDCKTQGKSDSLFVDQFINMRMISSDCNKEIVLRPSEASTQLSCGEKTVRSDINIENAGLLIAISSTEKSVGFLEMSSQKTGQSTHVKNEFDAGSDVMASFGTIEPENLEEEEGLVM